MGTKKRGANVRRKTFKYDKSILVMVSGDHLFHGTNHRINLLVDFLKKNVRHVTVVSPHPDVKPTQELIDKIFTRNVTYEDLIFREVEEQNLKYYLIPLADTLALPMAQGDKVPFVMKSYVPLLLKGRHFDICYSNGVGNAELPRLLKEGGFVENTVYLDVDYTPGFDYGEEFKKAAIRLENISIEANDVVVSVSQELADLRKRKHPGKMVIASPNGVRYDLFAKVQSTPREQPVMIYTGWLGSSYGVHFPIHAMPQIVKEIPDAKYMIIGFGDETYKQTLKELAVTLGVEKNVIFSDKQPYEKLPEFLQKARIGIATFENNEINQVICPLKVFEYFAAGLPVLGAHFGDLGRIMNEANAGITVETIDDIARGAITLFNDQKLYRKYRNNAIRYAKNFDIDHLLEKELNTIISIFEDRRLHGKQESSVVEYEKIPDADYSLKKELNSIDSFSHSGVGTGFYHDEGGWHWMSAVGNIYLPSETLPAEVSFELSCDQAEYYNHFPFEVRIYKDSELTSKVVFSTSMQAEVVKLQLNKTDRAVHIRLESSEVFVASKRNINTDDRELSVRLSKLYIQRLESTPQTPVVSKGVCNICGSSDGFELTNPNDPRESWVCRGCGSISRDRMYIYALAKALNKTTPLKDWSVDKSLRILEASGARAHPSLLVTKFDYLNTKYDPEVLAQPDYDRRCFADLQALDFPDGVFDVVMSSDVFEHVRLHVKALHEIYRVLKPDGVMILQVPFFPAMEKTLVRVQPAGEEDIYLLPPAYHAENTLVYRDYGADFIPEIEGVGFEVEVIETELPQFCITPQNVIIARKPEQTKVIGADEDANEIKRKANNFQVVPDMEEGTVKTPTVSVLLLCYNKLNYTRQCIAALQKNTNPDLYELVAINNASTDGTQRYLDKLSREMPNLKVLHNSENLGFIGGNNTAAEISSGKYLFFLNNDTEVQPGWLEPLIELMEKDPTVGAVGSKLIYPDGRLQEAGGMIFRDGSGWNFGRYDDPDEPEYNYVREVDYCSGAALMVRAELFRKIGGFDRRFEPAYWEDSDLCFAVRKAGYRVMYQPRSHVVHHEGVTNTTDVNTKTGRKKYQEIHRPTFLRKWAKEMEEQPPATSDMKFGRWVSDRRCRKGKQVLVAADEPPQHDRQGGGLTIFNFIKLLLEAGHHVTFVAHNTTWRDPDVDLEVYVNELRDMGVLVYRLDKIMLEGEVAPSALSIAKILTKRDYDVALLWSAREGHWFIEQIQKHSPATRIVVNSGDLGYLREGRQASLKNSPELWKQYNRIKAIELSTYRRADAVMTISEGERQLLAREIPIDKLFLVPDLFPVINDTAGFSQREGVVFLAGFRHLPNVDAAMFLLDEIMPHVRKKLPDVVVTIVGSEPPESIQQRANRYVRVTGYVPEIQPYLANARVSVVPVRYGAGIKGKALQAMAVGTPNVITTIGAEGMNLENGRHALIADTPEAFAEAIVSLYNNQELWERISVAGREKVGTDNSSEAVRKALFAALFPIKPDPDNDQTIEIQRFDRIAQGYEALRGQTFDLAKQLFTDDVARFPDLPDGYLGLGQLYMAEGNFTEAKKMIEKSISLSQYPSAAEVVLAELYERMGEISKAINLLEEIIAKDSDCLSAWVRVAQLRTKQKQWKKAEHAWLQVVRLSPRDLNGWYKKARVCQCLGNHLQALQDYARATMIALDMNRPDIAYALDSEMSCIVSGKPLRVRTKPDKKEFTRYCTIAKMLETIGKSIGRSGPISSYELERVTEIVKDFLSRKTPLNQIRQKAQGMEDILLALARMELNSARENGNPSQAELLEVLVLSIPAWTDSTPMVISDSDVISTNVAEITEPSAPGGDRVWSEEVVTHIQHADKCVGRGDYVAAKEALDKALALVPDNPELIVAHGNVMLQLGDVEAARRDFVKATVLAPNHVPAYINLAAVLLHLGRPKEAEASIRRALSLNPDDVDALKLLARLYLDSERYDEAIQTYREVLRQRSEDVDTLLTLGNCYFEAGDLNSARVMYERVLEIDPDNAVAMDNLAVVHSEADGGNLHSMQQATTQGETFSGRIEDRGKKTVDVSIVIPVFNEVEYTRKCLEALYHNTSAENAFEVIVVDNGSTDDTQDFLQETSRKYQNLQVLINDENLGFARACNQGARLAQGKFLLFLNNDTLPHQGWLEALMRMVDADPQIGVVGSKLLYPDGTIQHAGIVFGIREGELQPYHIYLCQPADVPYVNKSREFQMVTGACLMIRRELFEQLGGFDEAFCNGHEDLDLCMRVREAGKKVMYCPESVVTHIEACTKRRLGLDNFHYRKGVDNEEGRGRRRFLEKWCSVLEIDDQRYYAEDGVTMIPEPLSRKSEKTSGSMHILFTMYGWADEGGGTILPRQIAQALVRRGHRVTVIYTAAQTLPGREAYYVEERHEEGVRLFGIYNRPALFYDLEYPEREVDDPHIRRIVAQIIAETKPDIVHYHSLLNFSMGVAEEINKAGIPSVYTSHNYWPLCPRMYLFQDDLALCSDPSADGSKCAACIGKFEKVAEYARRMEQGCQMLNRYIDRHLAVSHRVRQLFIRNGHDASRIQVLHQQPETVDWIWQKLGANRQPIDQLTRPLKVGFIGTLLPQKGVHVLVKALQVFQASQIEGHVFGSGPELYVSNLRQADRGRLVHFHGRYEPSELPKLLSQVDVIVVPSIWEDCAPLVVAEALTARCPVIGSRIGGIPEFIEDGVNGFLFDPRDSAGLASVLYQFISNSSLLGRMQRTIQPPRGFNTYLDELISHYREVIAIHRQQVKEQICSFPENEHPVVVWEGSQFVHHSLALINRELCLQLIDRGYEVSIIPYEIDQFGPEADPRFQKLAARVRASLSRPVDVHVRHQWPPNFTPPSEGHWVMIQPWEFGSLPKQWVEVMSTQVDEIWVPSNYVRECYIRSGIPADRVYVVPNGVDTDTFRPDVPPLELKTKKRFKFLFVGGTIFRKGIDILLDTYTNTFTSDDDVCLVIKDMCVHSFYKGQTFTEKIRQIQGNPKAPEILYITEDMEPGCLPSLYTACDCLVHPYRGEGFGLPIVEAMACGLPVIVTAHGAASDFCTKKNAYLIPAQEIRFSQKCVGDMETVDYPWLAEPDSAALKRLMLHVVTKPAENRTKGQIARACIQAHFTWKQAGEAAQKRIETLRRQPIRRFAAKTFLTADRTLISQTGSRAQGKRILIIDPFLPMYDRASGSRYLFESLKIMTSMGHAVTFIARNGQNQERYADELRQMGIEVHATDPDKLRELGHEVQASPIDLQRLLMEKQYDVAILSFYEIAEQYLEDIQRFSPGTRIYIDTHDVHFLREQRQAELYRNRKLSLKAAETKRRELAIYRKADALIARSEEDRRHLLAEIPDATIYVVHNIHDIATNVPPWAERKGLLFVGNFWHPPNADAVLYFCEEILPQIRAEIPDVTFTIVGNSPPPKVQALAGDGIVVTGYVPQIEPYLRSCRVSVAPLRYGAGLKGKVGEALAAGLPVVTTSIGVEGMELPADQQVLLVADDAQAFAETVVQVYRNEALWQALSEAGRNYVKTHYSPQVVAKEIENMLTDHTFQSRHSLFTSIIILNHNGLVHLKKCLASIEAHTPEPHEIIIVDNGSTDDTLDYLRDYSVRHDNVRVIVNASNRGFTAGNNQGLALARGEYVILLNNDTIVTEGWLRRMLAVFERHPRTGIVGPMSDNVSGPQQVPNVSCLTEREVETFAARWAVEHAGQDIPITRLVGFCLLARKEVIDRIGGLDEQFGSGGFDDDDLCVRVALAGYEARIARDVFIHHTGGGVLRREGDSKYSHNLRRNWELFKAKWGIPTDTPYEKGYYRLNLKSLDTSQLYLPLPDVSADHHPEADGRWWQDISGNGQKPRTKQGGAREDLADVQEMVNQLLAPGQKALDQGQLEAAAREFTQVTEHYPELAAGHAALGSTLMALGRTEEAIAALRRAIELAPQAADLHNQLGVALYQTGDLEGAEAAFRQAQQADPKDVQPLLNLIELYRSQERYVEATEAVKQALVLDANHPDVLLAFGTLSLELGDVEGAQMALRRLQTLQPDYPCPLALREVLGQPNKNRQKMATTNAPISA